jgi:hypothetical protein
MSGPAFRVQDLCARSRRLNGEDQASPDRESQERERIVAQPSQPCFYSAPTYTELPALCDPNPRRRPPKRSLATSRKGRHDRFGDRRRLARDCVPAIDIDRLGIALLQGDRH